MEKEVRQLEEKYKDLEQLKVLEGKIEDLKKEIAWAQVIEKEKVWIFLCTCLSVQWCFEYYFFSDQENMFLYIHAAEIMYFVYPSLLGLISTRRNFLLIDHWGTTQSRSVLFGEIQFVKDIIYWQ